jgi:hypothetical protein
VLFLDADDYLHPHCLSKVVGRWKQGCVKAHFYLDVVDESGASLHAVVPSGRLATGIDALKMMRLFGAYCSPPASGNIYSRDFLAKVLPMENETQLWRGGADAVTIFAAPYFGTIAAVPLTLGFYRRHADASGAVVSRFQLAVSLEKLKKEHQKDLLRDRSWRLAARQTEKPKLLEPSRLKRRICYLRLARSGLDPEDNRLNLFIRGALSSLKWDGYSWTQKIAMTGWFMGMAILPLKVAESLIRPALGITNRTPRLRKFLEASRRSL